MGNTTNASRAGHPVHQKSIRLRTWGSQVRDLPGAPLRAFERVGGSWPGSRNRPGVELAVTDLVEAYRRKHCNEYNLRPNVVAEYERHLAAFVEAVGDVVLTALSEEHIHAFFGTCASGSLPSCYSVIAALLRWGDRRALDGLADLVPQRKPVRRWRTRHMTLPEIKRVVMWITERRKKPRARLGTLDAIELGIVCPLRRSEIVSLQTHEVDLDASRLFLHDTKSGNRVVPLPSVGREVCRRRMLAAPGTHLFPARNRDGHMHSRGEHVPRPRAPSDPLQARPRDVAAEHLHQARRLRPPVP